MPWPPTVWNHITLCHITALLDRYYPMQQGKAMKNITLFKVKDKLPFLKKNVKHHIYGHTPQSMTHTV